MATMTMPTPAAVAAGLLDISVNRRDLLAELEMAIGVIERKTTIPILANLLLVADANALRITATDLDHSLSTSLAAEVKKPGCVTAPARKLYEYVKLLSGDKVTIRQTENAWISIGCGRSKTRMVGMVATNFPAVPQMEVSDEIDAELLRGLIAKTIIAVSEEASRYQLACALLEVIDGEIRMVATDGHRMMLASQNAYTPKKLSMLIPKKALVELRGMLKDFDGPIRFGEDHNILYFEIGSRKLTSRKIAGAFPNYRAVLPEITGTGVLLDVAAVAETLNRCVIFSERDTRCIALTLSEKSIGVKSAARDLGETDEEIEIHGGPAAPVMAKFNGDFIRDLFSVIDGTVEAHITGHASAAVFIWRSDEGMTLKYVAMPMRGN